jgi:hypothetical protein
VTAKKITKKRSAAWRRTMEDSRRKAVGMLEQIGPNADHLPEEARKEEHRKLTAEIERVVHVIDRHLREAQPEKPSPPRAARTRGRGRPG